MPGSPLPDLLRVRDPRHLDASWANPAGCEAVAIASSLGGTAALRRVLGCLDPDQSPPVFLAHHKGWIDPELFIACIERSSRLPIRVAERGQSIERGVAYVAPAGGHLLVSSERRLSIPRWGHVGYVCPSANLLFSSVARVYGDRAVAVVLSGLSSDGAEGARAIRRRGGFVIAQSAASAQRFDMPSAALEAQAVDVLLDADEIGPALRLLHGG
jgi:two-component system, chemotaxis family, protein-glutamate methylesterase/glutaminase